GFVDRNMIDDMHVLDEVVFKIHKNGYFELDPLRYVNGLVSSVSAFTYDRDIFSTCLNWILSSIVENKWALFYCLPNKSLEKGLKLIHTDNDVHSFFADAKCRGKIHLYVTHKQQALGKFYLKNIVWLEEDASLRCSSLSPFSTSIKRKSHKTTKECGRKNSRGKEKMVDDEPLGIKLLKTSRKGKEKMDEFPDSTTIQERQYCDDRVGRMSMQTFLNELGEFPDLTPTKEIEVDDEAVGRNSIRTRRKGREIMAEFSGTPTNEKKVVVTNYRRDIITGEAKMVEVADVGLVEDELNLVNKKDLVKKPVRLATNVHWWYQNVKTNELPENYFVFEVHYDGVFSEYPLRCSLGEGLTIVEDVGDTKKPYDIAEKYGLVKLYIAHIPENLAEYYFKILTLDASDEEVKPKVKSHEKRKLHASVMSPRELVDWAEQEAGSPYLRTPPIKSRRKGIEFPYGPIDVGGPSTWCDLVYECVVENGDSLSIMDKECFSNNVVLDDVVPANIPSMPLLLMKKGRNKGSVTRKSRCQNNSKTFRLRKGFGKRVACGANTRRLGGSPSLNVHVVDEVSQVTKQGSLSAGSSNTEDKDLGSMSAGSSSTDDKDLEKSN
ncbi:hypothetical protein Tco_0271444, partial [Tanacetum coccineum]